MFMRLNSGWKHGLAGAAALGVFAVFTLELVAQHPLTSNFRRRMPRPPSVPATVSNPLGQGADPPGFNPNQVFNKFPTNAPVEGSTESTGGGGAGGLGAGGTGGTGLLNAFNNQSIGNTNLLPNRGINGGTVIQNGFNRNAIIRNNFSSNAIMQRQNAIIQRNAIIQNGIRRNAIIRNNFRSVPVAPLRR